MKKRTYFLTSLPLAVAALGAQLICLYLIVLTVNEAAGRMMGMLYPPLSIFTSPTPAKPTIGFGNIPGFLSLAGLVLALASLASLIMCFRRHEPGRGWRLIPITLLTLYLGTWLVLLQS